MSFTAIRARPSLHDFAALPPEAAPFTTSALSRLAAAIGARGGHRSGYDDDHHHDDHDDNDDNDDAPPPNTSNMLLTAARWTELAAAQLGLSAASAGAVWDAFCLYLGPEKCHAIKDLGASPDHEFAAAADVPAPSPTTTTATPTTVTGWVPAALPSPIDFLLLLHNQLFFSSPSSSAAARNRPTRAAAAAAKEQNAGRYARHTRYWRATARTWLRLLIPLDSGRRRESSTLRAQTVGRAVDLVFCGARGRGGADAACSLFAEVGAAAAGGDDGEGGEGEGRWRGFTVEVVARWIEAAVGVVESGGAVEEAGGDEERIVIRNLHTTVLVLPRPPPTTTTTAALPILDIAACSAATIFAPFPCRHVLVARCSRGTRVLAGPVAGRVVVHCDVGDETTVSAACGGAAVSARRQRERGRRRGRRPAVRLLAWCMTRPVLAAVANDGHPTDDTDGERKAIAAAVEIGPCAAWYNAMPLDLAFARLVAPFTASSSSPSSSTSPGLAFHPLVAAAVLEDDDAAAAWQALPVAEYFPDVLDDGAGDDDGDDEAATRGPPPPPVFVPRAYREFYDACGAFARAAAVGMRVLGATVARGCGTEFAGRRRVSSTRTREAAAASVVAEYEREFCAWVRTSRTREREMVAIAKMRRDVAAATAGVK
ncbi:hypothetical protein DFJ73DRAFT_797870 [Zopfochytrium polystomum]|nr:hypothetical protein DFJ73DRAFT_797870 [Zopfochytrium polystomum]